MTKYGEKNIMAQKPSFSVKDDCTDIERENNSGEKGPSALILAEEPSDGNSTSLFSRMGPGVYKKLKDIGVELQVSAGDTVFSQGEQHNGIFLIETGVVRTFYVGSNGREITLAHWSRGHFVGGPEIFGGGQHIWSGIAADDCKLLKLGGDAFRSLVEKSNILAVCLLEGSIQKGKCYSALLQMLGTRSVVERLAQLLLILSESEGLAENDNPIISRVLTHEELASMVGATRQWVTVTLDKFRKAGAIRIVGRNIQVTNVDFLMTKTGI